MLKNTAFNWESIVDYIQIVTRQNQTHKTKIVLGKDIDWSLIPSGFPACQLIDLGKFVNLSKYAPQNVIFRFYKTENLGLSLKIEDNMKTLKKRSLRSQSQDYDGPTIELNLNDSLKFAYYLGHRKSNEGLTDGRGLSLLLCNVYHNAQNLL